MEAQKLTIGLILKNPQKKPICHVIARSETPKQASIFK